MYATDNKLFLFLVALLAASVAAQTRTFYFYPPDDSKWIAGRSYITNDPSNMDAAVALQLEPTKCGWYKATYTTANPPPSYVQIWLGKTGTDKIGSKGRLNDPNLNEESSAILAADPNDYIAAIGTIELNSKFQQLGNNIYFVADYGYEDGWSSTDPMLEDAERCSFKLAAFIYDTDRSVNCAFNVSAGFRRGIVQPTLDANRKLQFNTSDANQACFNNGHSACASNASNNNCIAGWSAADFSKAWDADSPSNVTRCYDLPFQRSLASLWEFNSNQLCRNGGVMDLNGNCSGYGGYLGGFFPDELQTAGDADYSECPTCLTTYGASGWQGLANTVNRWCCERAWGGTGNGTGDLSNAQTPAQITAAMTAAGCTTPLNGTGCATAGASNPGSMPNKNFSFCFESHAEFTYESDQEFFFSGDDDVWIFINGQLVLDLGGVHSAVPGYIKLDTIKTPEPLVEGKEYPIDIFFCERNVVQSNIRITTNMYVAQRSNFDVVSNLGSKTMCITASGGADCASKMGMGSSEQILCADDLVNGGYAVEFFMVRRGTTDTLWLEPSKNSDCNGDANVFECYNGIKVNNAIYTCGGFGQCQGNPAATAKVNIPGNFTVYVRPMQGNVQMAKPKMIDQFKSEAQTRVVWGNLTSEDDKVKLTLQDSYGDTAAREQNVMVGRATPVYVATGSWSDIGAYTSFLYDNEEDYVTTLSYSLSGYGSLKVTADSLGDTLATFPRRLPPSGVDTVWVHIPWSVGEQEYGLNVVSEAEDAPSLKIKTYHPVLRFTKEDYATSENPIGYNIFLSPGDTMPPLVGTGLQVYLVAEDTVRGGLCESCTFYLTDTSFTNNEDINDANKSGVIYADDIRMLNGKASIIISGLDVVKDTNHATWQVFGPNKELTNAEWTMLQFRESPIPQPRTSYIHDRNGDGIGDSISIEYSKSFFVDGLGSALADSLLPVLIEVVWDAKDTVRYHVSGYTPEFLKVRENVQNLYTDAAFRASNKAYWEKFVSTTEDSLLVIAEPTTAFSKTVLTQGKGTVISITPYIDIDKCPTTSSCPPAAFTYTPSQSAVLDRIPPIVVKAEYTMDKTKNCADNQNPGCRETLVVYLSEPIYADPDAGMDLTKNPFSYCFEYSQSSACLPSGTAVPVLNQAWNNLDWDWELPKQKNDRDTAYIVKYRQNKRDNMPIVYEHGTAAAGDSVLEMTYYAYKISGEETTRMPKGNDWIKIRPPSSGDVFRDAEGNVANPKEIGMQITGTNYFRKDQIKIGNISKDAQPGDPPLYGIFEDTSSRTPPWYTQKGREEARETLYKPGNVAELLPIPRGMKPDSVKYYHPGSVGTVFDVADNIANEVSKILDECAGKCFTEDGQPLTDLSIANGITVHAAPYYHTNLGTYTAHRDKLTA